MNTCPQCHESSKIIKRGFTIKGYQRYRCGSCMKQFSDSPQKRLCSEELIKIQELHAKGQSYAAIGRAINRHPSTILLWTKILGTYVMQKNSIKRGKD